MSGDAMFLMRLILLVLLGLMLRRIFRAVRSVAKRETRRRQDPGVRTPPNQRPSTEYSDLTEQGIDDADFEEIP